MPRNSQNFLLSLWNSQNREHQKYLWNVIYICQLSRLRVENFDLTPTHTCGPISHAWLKNVSCCRPAWHNFQKYVNSDPCKERKPCVKWINGNTFLAISDFWSEKHWERARLWQTSDVFGNDHDFFKKPSTPRIKISRSYLRKSWQVYVIVSREISQQGAR